jgi:hypothetical protein
MTTEDPVVQFHRSFRDRIEIEKMAADAKRRRGHLGGAGLPAPKVSDTFDRMYRAFVLKGNKLQPIDILRRRDQRFVDYATEWERQYSILATDKGKYTPVLDENLTVIGHTGSFTGNYFADTIIATEAFSRKPNSQNEHYADDLSALIKGEYRVFVHDRRKTPPAGWSYLNIATTEHKFEAVTGINGEVIDSVRSNTGFLEEVAYSPADLLSFGKLIVTLGAKIGSKVAKTLMRKAIARRAAKTLDGPTISVAKEAAEKMAKEVSEQEAKLIFKGIKLKKGYDPRMGVPEEHFLAMVEAAKEAHVIAIFRSNKKAAIELIRKGAHGKPMWAKFKTSAETGVLTAKTQADVAIAHANGHFTIGPDGLASRMIMKNGKPHMEVLKIDKPFWKTETGQVIAPDGKPIVGDYDLLGVAPIKSPGRNINVVPEDAAYGDWTGPDVIKYQKAVNGRMKEPRVLHGAQDGYGGNPKYMGLTDDTAYAVFPDGRTVILEGKKAQQEFYDALGRQAKQTGAPVGKPGWKPTVVQGGKK